MQRPSFTSLVSHRSTYLVHAHDSSDIASSASTDCAVSVLRVDTHTGALEHVRALSTWQTIDDAREGLLARHASHVPDWDQ